MRFPWKRHYRAADTHHKYILFRSAPFPDALSGFKYTRRYRYIPTILVFINLKLIFNKNSLHQGCIVRISLCILGYFVRILFRSMRSAYLYEKVA